MEALIPLLLFAFIALVAPIFGTDTRADETTWPGAPATGRDARRIAYEHNRAPV